MGLKKVGWLMNSIMAYKGKQLHNLLFNFCKNCLHKKYDRFLKGQNYVQCTNNLLPESDVKAYCA